MLLRDLFPPRRATGRVARRSGGLPALYAPDPRAAGRVVEFFTAHIRNPHTRIAYARAAAGIEAVSIFKYATTDRSVSRR